MLCHIQPPYDAECNYAECRIIIVLSDVMLNVVMLSVIMLNVVMLSVVILNVFMLSVVMLKVVAPIQRLQRILSPMV
jgi:hypothetical protein